VDANLVQGFLLQRCFFYEGALGGYIATDGATGDQVELWVLQDSAWRGAPETVLQSKVKSLVALKHPSLLTPQHALRLRGFTAFVFPKFDGATLEALLARMPILGNKAVCQIGMDVANALTYLNSQKVIRAELDYTSVLVGAQPPAVVRYTGLIDMIRMPDLDRFRPQVNLQELGTLLYRCVTGQNPDPARWVDPIGLNNRVWPALSQKIREMIFTPNTAAETAAELQQILLDNTTAVRPGAGTQRVAIRVKR
jgi:hypothetical protein